ncbi:hypothetical protein [Paraburkholderia phenazinium]|uniref:Uncharacterized protein n=1 Tax=Paraburkholderia phenazinium TaxID=60549 RepID=A0A1N6ECC8_9BURK|nr:hypothetical protein [Paraburkholderia phenazinium]SIN80692.1 hypothetical protein SAMN05444168_0448 [Paraburkholderia phenazinium]
MYSGLAKLLDKPFVMGFFLPSLLGILGFLFANSDRRIFLTWLQNAFSGTAEFGGLAVIIGSAWVFSVLLMALNTQAYRLLEGYYWPWTTKWAKHGQNTSRASLRRAADLLSKKHDYEEAKANNARSSGLESSQAKQARTKASRAYGAYLKANERRWALYPENPNDVLGTRFGNVIRAFETYPTYAYGVDSISVWPRLQCLISKEYQVLIGDARSTVDFMVCSTLLFCAVGLYTTGRAIILWMNHTPDSSHLTLFLLRNAAISIVIARLCYGRAVASAQQWGEYVKGAFDLYLPALAQQLGYALPRDAAARRMFWSDWSSQFRFFEAVDDAAWKPVFTVDTENESQSKSKSDEDKESEDEQIDEARPKEKPVRP